MRIVKRTVRHEPRAGLVAVKRLEHHLVRRHVSEESPAVSRVVVQDVFFTTPVAVPQMELEHVGGAIEASDNVRTLHPALAPSLPEPVIVADES